MSPPTTAPVDRAPSAARPRRRRRWGWLVALLPAVLALALIVGGMVTRAEQAQVFDAAVATYDIPDGRAVAGPVAYDRTPPVGGDHAPRWQQCGVYDARVPDERAVAALRRGAVWITFQPDASEDEVAQLAAFAASPRVLVSPYPGQRSPVVATAWGRQLQVASPNDWELSEFVRRYQGGAQAPAGGAGCAGGVTSTAP